MSLLKCTVGVLPVLLLCCLQMDNVDSFVSFLPSNTDEDSAETYDSFDQPKEPVDTIEDKLLYKLLNTVLMERMRMSAQAQNNGYYESAPEDSLYPATKRGLSTLGRMMKRKVFWQPIGFMPTKVNQSGGSSAQGSSQSQAGQPFRYG